MLMSRGWWADHGEQSVRGRVGGNSNCLVELCEYRVFLSLARLGKRSAGELGTGSYGAQTRTPCSIPGWRTPFGLLVDSGLGLYIIRVVIGTLGMVGVRGVGRVVILARFIHRLRLGPGVHHAGGVYAM